MLELKLRSEGGWSVVGLVGRLDVTAAPNFERQCDEWIGAGHTRMILDFSRLEYISSAGLSSIITAAKALQAVGGRFAIAGLAGVIKEVFSITGFATLFPNYPDVEAALRAT
ncbi:MAG TPA: STAS domain-containing protein [Thermoanaerobaculaceae bacterium]|nr:STAS domain-containing protein [Thermoanaerobaculaceae bacterium]